jgi:glycerol kinase
MDSMPVRTLAIPSLDSEIHKSTDPDTKVSHVENTSEPVTIEHHEHLPSKHLPRGLAQTGEEQEKQWFVGSIDQGTTSSRFLVFDGEGNPVASHQIEFENIYPDSG